MVWCAVTRYEIIGPYFFENENVTLHRYMRMLRYLLFRGWKTIRKTRHFSRMVPPKCRFGNSIFEQKVSKIWIGSGGSISWPARFPDLSRCDYFLWGYQKDIVYRNSPSTLEEVQNNKADAICSFDNSILEKVYRNLETRLSLVVRENGGRFEYLKNQIKLSILVFFICRDNSPFDD